jgi:OmpA-OmpF porin, OOP family
LSIIRPLIIAFTLLLLITTPGFSVTEVPKSLKPIVSVGVTPSVGGYFSAGSQSLDPTLLYGLKFTYDKIGSSFHDTLGVEGTFNYFSTKTKSDKQTATGMLYRLDAVYSITPRNEWVPFLALGAGWMQIDRNGTSDGSPLLDLGLGVKYFYDDYLAIRLDARQLFVYENVGTTNNFELSTGLTYFFGKERRKKVAPAAKPKTASAPAVPKISDEPEAEEPTGEEPSMLEKIGAIGAAILGITTTPPEYEPPAYVTDLGPRSKAVPPAAPAPAPVVPAPAPQPAGQAVQPEAPLVGQRTTKTLTFEFDFSSPHLRPMYRSEIAAAAALIKAAEKSSVVIEGHTDNVGKHQPNIVLSEKRARSVKDALVESGVDPKAVAIKGYGFTKPKASNKTPEGRQKNRRTTAVISVIKSGQPAKEKK